MMPTTSAAIVEPIHNLCIARASSVMPSGHPQLSQLPATWSYEHPLSVSAPRRPSPATFASLLRRATARCLLIPRAATPRGLPGGVFLGCPTGSAHTDHSLPETSRPRLSSEEREEPRGGSPTPSGTDAPDLGRRHAARSDGYSRAVYRRLLTWRWVLMHLLVAALFVATFFLGHWQLGKAEDGGGAVNWSYALQWPLYGFMGLGFYLRMVRDELRRDPAEDEPGTSVVLYQRPRIDTTGDPELAAYNAYLAELNAKALGQQVNGGR